MPRLIVILAVLTGAAIAGGAIWLTTSSATASFVVGVVGAGAGIAALVPEQRSVPRLRARVKLRNVRDSTVVGVDLGRIERSDVNLRAKDVDGSNITGIRSTGDE